jgi:hypothetical protein
VTTKDIKNTLSKIAEDHFEQLIDFKAGVIPDGIALNTPLKENFINACLFRYAHTFDHLWCSWYFQDSLHTDLQLCSDSKRHQKCAIFKRYKGINAMYYGGSQTSTSEGISKVFQRGEKYLENKGEDRPVVVFDEIGLAELSPYNPLKILHPLLERVDVEVGFLGLSNWTLDLSKMNRLIYLARPDMTRGRSLRNFQDLDCKVHQRQYQARSGDFPQIPDHRLPQLQKDGRRSTEAIPTSTEVRDIYGVSKFIYQNMLQVKHYDTSAKTKQLIKTAIERNFNGAIYLFGRRSRE